MKRERRGGEVARGRAHDLERHVDALRSTSCFSIRSASSASATTVTATRWSGAIERA